MIINPCPAGQLIFFTEDEAKKSYRYFKPSVRVWPYQCPECHGWHCTRPKRIT